MIRTDIINKFVKNTDSYLEIGVRNINDNFTKINCLNKYAVDPDTKSLDINNENHFIMTSDVFFEGNKKMFDVVFIDGLHLKEQVYRDIKNSFKFLNEDGVVILHDTLPYDERMQIRDFNGYDAWTGDTWKGVYKFIIENKSDYEITTVNTDFGVTIIRRGKNNKSIINNDLYKLSSNFNNFDDYLTYQIFNQTKFEVLNIIDVCDFNSMFTSINIFLHCYLVNGWYSIVTEILSSIINSGLYDKVDNIYVGLDGSDEYKKLFKRLFEDQLDKLHVVIDVNGQYEYPILNYAINKSKSEKFIGVYGHTKGATSFSENHIKSDYWRRSLIQGNFIDWEDKLDAIIKSYDLAGVQHYTDGDSSLFAGNYFWFNSEYFKNLNIDDCIHNRFICEFGICNKQTKIYSPSFYLNDTIDDFTILPLNNNPNTKY